MDLSFCQHVHTHRRLCVSRTRRCIINSFYRYLDIELADGVKAASGRVAHSHVRENTGDGVDEHHRLLLLRDEGSDAYRVWHRVTVQLELHNASIQWHVRRELESVVVFKGS